MNVALSKRESDVIKLLAEGKLVKEISSELGISLGSAKQYISRAYRKLNVSNGREAVARYCAQSSREAPKNHASIAKTD